jgi:hypothetical protein
MMKKHRRRIKNKYSYKNHSHEFLESLRIQIKEIDQMSENGIRVNIVDWSKEVLVAEDASGNSYRFNNLELELEESATYFTFRIKSGKIHVVLIGVDFEKWSEDLLKEGNRDETL